MITIIEEEFPFEEIRKESGDYFDSIKEMKDLGFTEHQMWSVTYSDSDDGYVYTYGPRGHCVNLLGYVATQEKHDGDTYYDWLIELVEID